jgi:hypothetical protein
MKQAHIPGSAYLLNVMEKRKHLAPVENRTLTPTELSWLPRLLLFIHIVKSYSVTSDGRLKQQLEHLIGLKVNVDFS